MSYPDQTELLRLREENANLRADNEAFQRDIIELSKGFRALQLLVTEQSEAIQKLMVRVKL